MIKKFEIEKSDSIEYTKTRPVFVFVAIADFLACQEYGKEFTVHIGAEIENANMSDDTIDVVIPARERDEGRIEEKIYRAFYSGLFARVSDFLKEHNRQALSEIARYRPTVEKANGMVSRYALITFWIEGVDTELLKTTDDPDLKHLRRWFNIDEVVGDGMYNQLMSISDNLLGYGYDDIVDEYGL